MSLSSHDIINIGLEFYSKISSNKIILKKIKNKKISTNSNFDNIFKFAEFVQVKYFITSYYNTLVNRSV